VSTTRSYFLYLIECQNGSIYTGITTDVKRRWQAHLNGQGAKYTRAFPPKKLMCYWPLKGGRSQAQSLEKKIKSLSHIQKKNLANSKAPWEKILNLIDN